MVLQKACKLKPSPPCFFINSNKLRENINMKNYITKFIKDIFCKNKVFWLLDEKGQIIDGYTCESRDELAELEKAHKFYGLSEYEFLEIN